MVVFGVLDLDYALLVDTPTALVIGVKNYDVNKTYDAHSKKWERFNRMSLMITRNSISEAIRGAIPTSEKAKMYLASVKSNSKAPPRFMLVHRFRSPLTLSTIMGSTV